MPPSKDLTAKQAYGRSMSNNDMVMSAKVYHHATNLMPSSPPHSPTGVAPSFAAIIKSSSTSSWGRQNSQNDGKHS